MKRVKFFALHLICLTVSLTLFSTVTQAEDNLKNTGAQTQPSHTARFIHFANALLTVKVKDVALQELLHEIARQGGLTLVLSGSLEDRITVEFHQLDLDEALRRILRHQSFVVEYSQQTPEESQSAVRRPEKLWILSQGEKGSPGQTTLGADSEGGGSLHAVGTDIPRLQAALTSADSSEREEAVEALGESGRPEAVAPLSLALADEDVDVRKAAIVALGEIGGDKAAQALAIALQDEDSSVREEAVEALGEIGGQSAILFLEQVLTDHDESVRETAAGILEELRDQIR